jgi:valyl-tRNA synthetase
VHRAPWPSVAELTVHDDPQADPRVLTTATEVLGAIRRAKSAAKQSIRAEVAHLSVHGPRDVLEQVRGDLVAAGNILSFEVVDAELVDARVTL